MLSLSCARARTGYGRAGCTARVRDYINISQLQYSQTASARGHRDGAPLFDHTIVGNGILGLTVAFRLFQLSPKSKICIVGKESRNACATVAAGAMLGTFGEITEETFANSEDEMYFEMSHKAQKLWPQFVDELNDYTMDGSSDNGIKINKNGTYVMLNNKGTSKDDTPNYESILAALERYNEPYSKVKGADIEGHFPEETSRAFEALYIPNERSIDPNTVMNGLDKILKRADNVTFINENADKVLTTTKTTNKNKQSVKGISFTDGGFGGRISEIHSKNVVICAGVGSQKLINSVPEFEGEIPYILSGNGVSFLIDQSNLPENDRIKHVLRTPNRAGACGLHLVPRGANHAYLYIGAGNMMNVESKNGVSFESTVWILSSILKEFNRGLGGTQIMNFFSGARPYTLDGYPIFGKSDKIDGIWFLCGTGRDGFHCSPLLSLYLAKQLLEIKGKDNDYIEGEKMFKMFSPERKLIQQFSQKDSVKLAQNQAHCALHETGGLLTTDLYKAFPDWIERDVWSIYNDLDTKYALSSLILLPLICRNSSLDKTFLKNLLKKYEARDETRSRLVAKEL